MQMLLFQANVPHQSNHHLHKHTIVLTFIRKHILNNELSRYMMEHIIHIISSFLYLCLSPSLSRPLLITSSPLWRAAWRREPKASLCLLVASGCCASWTTLTCLLTTYLDPNLRLNCCASGLTMASGMTTRTSPKSLSK